MKRIAIIDNGFVFEESPFTLLGDVSDLTSAIGRVPDRKFEGVNTIHTWDELGLIAYTEPDKSQVHEITICFRNASHQFSPTSNYTGLVAVNGVSLHSDSSRQDLNSSGLQGNSHLELYMKNLSVFACYEKGLIELGAGWHEDPQPIVLSDDTPVDATIRCVTFGRYVKAISKHAAGPKAFDAWHRFHCSLVEILSKYGEVTGNTSEEDPDFYHSGDWFDTYSDGFAINNVKILSAGLLREILRCVMQTHPEATVEFCGIEGDLDDITIGVTSDGIYSTCSERTPCEFAGYLNQLGGNAESR